VIDRLLAYRTALFDAVYDEHIRQVEKWGVQDRTPFEWLTYTTEELGEVANAISECEYRDGNKREVVKEAIQLATLALKIAEMYSVEYEAAIEKGRDNETRKDS
jgi:NTP pyrophosphatase (non-canonical NTP hydrolase)